jgi:RNA 2',3'-cyclic 3'-phosphodiesterase
LGSATDQLAVFPNWFLAFPIHAEWVVELPALPPRFRRFSPTDVHLTLMFLGACGEAAALSALEATRASFLATPCEPIAVTFGEVVPMGPKKEYSALSALLDQGRDEVTGLLRTHRDVAADAAGIRRDKRAPVPHVTLGRPQRRATDDDRKLGLAWAASVVLPSAAQLLNSVALYTWDTDRRAALFRVVATCGFGHPL